jgi:hypothetical protein
MNLNARTILLVIIFFQSWMIGFSQTDSILAAPPEKRVKLLWDWYKRDLSKLDSANAMKELLAAESFFIEKDQPLLRQQTWLMQQCYFTDRIRGTQQAVDLIMESARKANAKRWKLTEAECWQYVGVRYYDMARYGPAFEYLLRANKRFREYGYDKYPHLLRYADALGYCFYQFGENEQAIKYFEESIVLPEPWNSFISVNVTQNTIALCFQRLKQYDSAIYYYKKSYAASLARKDSFWMALANGNTGYVYFLQGNDSAALPLLEADFKASIRANEPGSAANAAMTLAAIYLKKRAADSAENYINFAKDFVYKNPDIRLYKTWYQNLSGIYKLKGDYVKALAYNDSFQLYRDSVQAFIDTKSINQAKLKLEMEQHLYEINLLESQRKQQVLTRNILLLLVISAAIISLLWINQLRIKRKKELQLTVLQKERTERELVQSGQELSNYMDKLKEKNQLIESFKSEIEKLQRSGEQQSEQRINNLNSLLNSSILTEADWNTFRGLFEKVYPGFFIRLKEKIPDISPAEIRLLALTKLQLSTKEMAGMLGIGYDAIKKTRQRLRKKINLPEEGSLDELVEMI